MQDAFFSRVQCMLSFFSPNALAKDCTAVISSGQGRITVTGPVRGRKFFLPRPGARIRGSCTNSQSLNRRTPGALMLLNYKCWYVVFVRYLGVEISKIGMIRSCLSSGKALPRVRGVIIRPMAVWSSVKAAYENSEGCLR